MSKKWLQWSFLIFLFCIPFGTKKFMYSFTPGVSEFTSFFFYATDFLLLLFLFAGSRYWFKRNSEKQGNLIGVRESIPMALFLFFVVVSIAFAEHKALASITAFRFLLLALFALSVGYFLKQGMVRIKEIALVLSLSAVFQSLVAFLQFKFQRHLGLWFLGESEVAPLLQGVAKIKVMGATLLRAYGTMPHANILAGFLILGIIGLFYLYLTAERRAYGEKIFFAIGLFFIWVGLALTFSRSGWIVAGIVTLFMIFLELLQATNRRTAVSLLVILFSIFFLLYATLGWAILPRVGFDANEWSVRDRWLYNWLGIELLFQKPFGVGIANQLLYSMDHGLFRTFGLTSPAEWQPIHNLYLLIATEVGIFGFLAFLNLLIVLVHGIGKALRKNPDIAFASAALLIFLVFGLFDHFSWDLHAGQLMFWLVLGIMMGVRPHSTMDSVQASGA